MEVTQFDALWNGRALLNELEDYLSGYATGWPHEFGQLLARLRADLLRPLDFPVRSNEVQSVSFRFFRLLTKGRRDETKSPDTKCSRARCCLTKSTESTLYSFS